jgi:hypothetical protein
VQEIHDMGTADDLHIGRDSTGLTHGLQAVEGDHRQGLRGGEAWYRRPRSCMERDRTVIEVLNQLVARRPRWGFWKLYDRLRLDDWMDSASTTSAYIGCTAP